MGAKIQIGQKEVEEVGFEKIRKQLAMLSELRIVLLDGHCIGGVQSRQLENLETKHDFDQAHGQMLQIVELDLSRNLLEEWASVVDICSGLKRLKILKVK